MMKKALFQTGCLLTSLTMFSSVFATAEGIEKVLFAKKEEVGFHETRNPFGSKEKYNAFIFSLDYKKLPGCVKAN